MKTILTILTLTILCLALICPPQTFAQNFVDGQMPDTFLNAGTQVYDIQFSPDGTTLASGSGDGMIKLWDVATVTLKAALAPHPVSKGHTVHVFSIAFSADGTILASGSPSGIKLWDVASGKPKATLMVQCFLSKIRYKTPKEGLKV